MDEQTDKGDFIGPSRLRLGSKNQKNFNEGFLRKEPKLWEELKL